MVDTVEDEAYLDDFIRATGDLFRCGICFSLLTETLENSCGHRFCSTCAEKHMMQEHPTHQQNLSCPLCPKPMSQQTLRGLNKKQENMRNLLEDFAKSFCDEGGFNESEQYYRNRGEKTGALSGASHGLVPKTNLEPTEKVQNWLRGVHSAGVSGVEDFEGPTTESHSWRSACSDDASTSTQSLSPTSAGISLHAEGTVHRVVASIPSAYPAEPQAKRVRGRSSIARKVRQRKNPLSFATCSMEQQQAVQSPVQLSIESNPAHDLGENSASPVRPRSPEKSPERLVNIASESSPRAEDDQQTDKWRTELIDLSEEVSSPEIPSMNEVLTFASKKIIFEDDPAAPPESMGIASPVSEPSETSTKLLVLSPSTRRRRIDFLLKGRLLAKKSYKIVRTAIPFTLSGRLERSSGHHFAEEKTHLSYSTASNNETQTGVKENLHTSVTVAETPKTIELKDDVVVVNESEESDSEEDMFAAVDPPPKRPLSWPRGETCRGANDAKRNRPSPSLADAPFFPSKRVDVDETSQATVVFECGSPCTKPAGRVFICSGLNRTQVKLVEDWASKIDAQVLPTYCDRVTHVIVTSDELRRTQRTLKYLYGVAGRKWILDFGWVVHSDQQGRPLDEELFEVLDADGDDGPRQARTSSRPLFADFKFCCLEPFTDIRVDQLRELLEACGAVTVARPSDLDHSAPHTFLVLQLDEDNQEEVHRQADAWLQMYGMFCVSREWVVDCLASYRLMPIFNQLLGNRKPSKHLFTVTGLSDRLTFD